MSRSKGKAGKEKAEEAYHPVIELVSFRLKFSPDSGSIMTTSLADMILDQQFPVKDKNHIKKLKRLDPSKVLPEYAPTFSFSEGFVKRLIENQSPGVVTEAYIIVVCFEAMYWILNRKGAPKESEFVMLLTAMSKIGPQTKLANVVKYAVQKIYEIGLDTKDFKWSEEGFVAAVTHIGKNSMLDNRFYPVFIRMMKLILTKASSETINGALILIDHLVMNSRIIDFNEIVPILMAIQHLIQNLDVTSLKILARLTTRSDISALRDAYMMVATNFVNFIGARYDKNTVPKLEDSIEDPPMPRTAVLNGPVFKFLDDFEGVCDFDAPPYEVLENKAHISEILPEQVRHKLMYIDECLCISSEKARRGFAATYLAFLGPMAQNPCFVSVTAAFLTMMKTCKDKEVVSQAWRVIAKSSLFNPNIHVFHDVPMNRYINTLRAMLVELIVDVIPEHILEFLAEMKDHPMIHAETMLRLILMREKVPMTTFLENNCMIQLIMSARRLQKLNQTTKSETIVRARSAYMIIIEMILSDPDTSFKALSTRSFITSFLDLMSEEKLSDTIILIFRNALAKLKIRPQHAVLGNAVGYIVSIINSCTNNCEDERYRTLAVKLSSAIVTALWHNPYLSLSFTGLLAPCFRFICAYPNVSMLNDILRLLTMLATSKRRFELTETMLRDLLNAIKAVDHDEPSLQTEAHLINLLRGALNGIPGANFLIGIPSVVPLIFAVFGRSARFSKVMGYMQRLCDFADYNKRMCHTGDLDLLILQFICGRNNDEEAREIKYRNCTFSIKCSNNEVNEILIPLFTTITMVKSSSAVTNYLVGHIIKKPDFPMIDLLSRLVSQSQSFPSPVFALGACHPQFTVKGMFGDDLSNGFTVHFMFNPDNQGLKESNINMNILSITDSQENALTLFINQETLYAKYEADGSRTTVHLKKYINSSVWTRFTVVFNFIDDHLRMSNFEGATPLNDSDLGEVYFEPDELEIVVGGTDSEEIPSNWRNKQIGTLGDLMIFPTKLTPREVSQLVKTPWEIVDTAIFNSAKITEPAYNHVEFTPRREHVKKTSLFEEIITECTINVHNTLPSSLSLIEVLVNGNECNHLADFFNVVDDAPSAYSEMIFGLIAQLFKRSEGLQRKFDQIPRIEVNLYNHPTWLTSNLYMSICNTLQEITYQPLREMWFERLVINTWLWARADYKHLVRIMHHWSHVLVPMYPALFGLKTADSLGFSSLLNQYMILFCTNEDGTMQVSLPNVTRLLNDTYGQNEVKTCAELFLTYLARVATVKLTESDSGPLFKHLANWKQKQTLIDLLHLMHNISKVMVSIPEFLKINECFGKSELPDGHPVFDIHNLLDEEDIDIIEMTLLVLHEITKENCLDHMFAAAKQLQKHPDPGAVFDRLVTRVEEYPNLLFVLFVMSLKLGREKISELGAVCKNFNNFEKLIHNRGWFIIPLIVAINVDEDDRFAICDFIITAVSKNITAFDMQISDIFCTVAYLQRVFPSIGTDLMNRLFISMDISLALNGDPKYALQVVRQMFYAAFFQLREQPFHKHILSQLSELDPVCGADMIEFPEVKGMEAINDLDSIEEMINFDPQCKAVFYLRLNEFNEWEDRQLAVSALSLIQRNGLEGVNEEVTQMTNILLYFTHSSQLDSEARKCVMGIAEEIFEDNRRTFQAIFEASHKICMRNMKEHLNKMKIILESRQKPTIDESEVMLMADYSCYAVPTISEKPKEVVYQRDDRICALFCPVKVKRAASHYKGSDELVNAGELILSKEADMVALKRGGTPAEVRVYKDYLVIETTRARVIPKKLITHIMMRKPTNTGTEVYLSDGRSYLLDFRTRDACSSFVKAIKISLPNCILTPEPDLFAILQTKEKWISRKISNFDYIIELNMLSGRSFKDATNYPFFPALFSDINDINSVMTTVLPGAPDVKHITHPIPGVRDAFAHEVVPADFFYRLESIDWYPEWAISPADFIRKLRQTLESEKVSQYLHLWISKYFSNDSKLTNGRLFKEKKHPMRCPYQEKIIEDYTQNINFKGEVIFTATNSDGDGVSNITALLSDGSVAIMKLNHTGEHKMDVVITTDPESVSDDAVFAVNNGQIAVFSKRNCTVRMITREDTCVHVPVFSELEVVAIVDGMFLFCPDTCSIAGIKSDGTVTVLCNTMSRIARVAADKVFKVLIVSTIDGGLHIYSLKGANNNNHVIDVNIGSEASIIAVTPNMGYIIAVTSKEIVVLNVNGVIISRTACNDEITGMYPCSSRNNFDYVFVVTAAGRIGVFEASNPCEINEFHETSDIISLIMYNSDQSSAVILTDVGDIKFLPFVHL